MEYCKATKREIVSINSIYDLDFMLNKLQCSNSCKAD